MRTIPVRDGTTLELRRVSDGVEVTRHGGNEMLCYLQLTDDAARDMAATLVEMTAR